MVGLPRDSSTVAISLLLNESGVTFVIEKQTDDSKVRISEKGGLSDQAERFDS